MRAAIATVAVGSLMALGAAAAHADLNDPVSLNQVQSCDTYTHKHNDEAEHEKHSTTGGNFECSQSHSIN